MDFSDGTRRNIFIFLIYIDGINCDPLSSDKECEITNSKFHKNKKSSDIKSHHYIISFDPADVTECGLSGNKAQSLCLELARKIFPGYQALVVTHTDGHNQSGNIHTHIVINSVRKYSTDRKPYMTQPHDHEAGYKHRSTDMFLEYFKKEVMEMCLQEGLHQIDLLSPAEEKITQKEYMAQQSGQKKLEKTNVKAMQSPAYAHRVKITNLQQMANTIIYVQEHGYNTQHDLKERLFQTSNELDEAENLLKQYMADLETVNLQIHYTGQYFANKELYSQFLKSKNKGKFRKEHSAVIQAYEDARDWLKSFYPDGKMHSINVMKSQKKILLGKIQSQKISVQTLKEKQKELETTDKNVDAILQIILAHKKKEYTGDRTDWLCAFKIVASLQNCSEKAALAGMMSKHIVSLYDMCYSSLLHFDQEQWDEKITDCINYLILLKALVTVAVVGASRRFLTQITRHQNEVKYVSASLQYSNYSGKAMFAVLYEIMTAGEIQMRPGSLC